MSSSGLEATNERSKTPLISPREERGQLGSRSVVKWQRPLFIALVIIGIIGLAALGTGLASFGTYHNYWHAGALSKLSQLGGILMMSFGALALTVSIVGLIKLHIKKKETTPNLEETTPNPSANVALTEENIFWDSEANEVNEVALRRYLPVNCYTFVRQPNCQYTKVTHNSVTDESSDSKIEIDTRDLSYEEMLLIKSRVNPNFSFHQTSPIGIGGTLVIEEEKLKEGLKPGTFTCVRQIDGNYTIVCKNKGGELFNSSVGVPHHLLPMVLQEQIRIQAISKHKFVLTSPLPFAL